MKLPKPNWVGYFNAIAYGFCAGTAVGTGIGASESLFKSFIVLSFAAYITFMFLMGNQLSQIQGSEL